jgi:cytochrome P450
MPVIGWRGNVIQLLTDPLGTLSRLRAEFGDVVTVIGGGISPQHMGTVYVFGPENNRAVTTGPAFRDESFLSGLMQNGVRTNRQESVNQLACGLFGMNGPIHRQRQALALGHLNTQRLVLSHDHILKITNDLVDSWAPSQVVDIKSAMAELAVRALFRALCSVDVEDAAELGKTSDRWFNAAASPAVLLFPIDIPGTPYNQFLNWTDYLHKRVRQMLADRKREQQKPDDLLTALIRATEAENEFPVTENQLMSHTIDFSLAGTSTAGAALMWTVFLISQHPQVAECLLQELSSLGESEPTPEDLRKLKFLDWVIKESLRLLPTAPIIGRSVQDPVELGGYQLQPGLQIGVSIYHTHHDPLIFAEPQKFNPWRWESITPSPYEYMPFGAGVHSCAGAQLAMLLCRVVIAKITRRYRLELQPGTLVDVCSKMSLTSRGKLPMIIHKQDGKLASGVTSVRGSIRGSVELP